MGDVAKGIKSFKKGMADDDVVQPEGAEPAKPVADQRSASVAETVSSERKAS